MITSDCDVGLQRSKTFLAIPVPIELESLPKQFALQRFCLVSEVADELPVVLVVYEPET